MSKLQAIVTPGACRYPKSKRQGKEPQRGRKKRKYRMIAHINARKFREVKLIAQDLTAALCQDMNPDLSDARVNSLTSWVPCLPEKQEKEEEEERSR